MTFFSYVSEFLTKDCCEVQFYPFSSNFSDLRSQHAKIGMRVFSAHSRSVFAAVRKVTS
jgi:hypothetical protein